MSKGYCTTWPEAKGEPSELYKGLSKKTANRPLTNYIYACYLSSDAKEKMDAAGMKRNKQDEHSIDDVVKFFGITDLLNKIGSLDSEERKEGVKDASGNRVNFTDAEEVLNKVDEYNRKNTNFIADVVKHGDIFNITLAEKNSQNYKSPIRIKEMLKAWEIYKHVFNSVGINITALPKELASTFSAYNTSIAQQLQYIKDTDFDHLSYRDALTLFSMDPTSPPVVRVINKFGSIEAAAQKVVDARSHVLPNEHLRLLTRAVAHCKQFKGLDLLALQDQINAETETIRNNLAETELDKALELLNKNYNIDANTIHRQDNKIRKLSEAVTDALFLIERKIRLLEGEGGSEENIKRLQKIREKLIDELAYKRFYQGLLNFLQEANNSQQEILDLIEELNNSIKSGTDLESAFQQAKIITKIEDIIDQYYDIALALSSKSLDIDESISNVEIENFRSIANSIKQFFEEKRMDLEAAKEATMLSIMQKTVGDETPDGMAMVNAIRMSAKDSPRQNFLYSMGRSTNVMISAMGGIIRDAQDARNKPMREFALRIRRANERLVKNGFKDTKFMYEDNGYIISDIDWDAFYKAKNTKRRELRESGLRGDELDWALKDWEQDNTMDLVVDDRPGIERTERIPNTSYRKEFPKLHPAQQEYYDTMMKIKGEIGTLLPRYAQKHFLPPQIRRTNADALASARSLKDVGKAISHKIGDYRIIREDDTNFSQNGVVDGEEYEIGQGDLQNYEIRRIPVYYVRKLKDQKELLKDFSGALQSFANTAISYNAMHEIEHVINFMGDYVTGQKGIGNNQKVDAISTQKVNIFKNIWRTAKNTNTTALVEGYISKHIYMQRTNPDEDPKVTKFMGNIIKYKSFKSLSTNWIGMVSNVLVGEYQMLVEAGAGEFYNLWDYTVAQKNLFGRLGDIGQLYSNNIRHKSVLLRELFDPTSEDFERKGETRYHNSWIRKAFAVDYSFAGYGAGEHFLHYVNMYAVLHHTKVLVNGKKTNLFRAFETTDLEDGNRELRLKEGTTTLEGKPIDEEFLIKVRRRIRHCNQTCHGAMNTEDKGLIHQRWLGRSIMNLRQWMVEHYSRRFRKTYWDALLQEKREGYWYTYWRLLKKDKTKEAWEQKQILKAIVGSIQNFISFTLWRQFAHYQKFDELGKRNMRRAWTETAMLAVLSIFANFVLGDPKEHKDDFWTRFWILQIKRLLTEINSGMPTLSALQSLRTIIRSPIPATDVVDGFFFILLGAFQGEEWERFDKGPHQGEIRYFVHLFRYVFPFYKNYEQIKSLGEDEALFSVFKFNPGR